VTLFERGLEVGERTAGMWARSRRSAVSRRFAWGRTSRIPGVALTSTNAGATSRASDRGRASLSFEGGGSAKAKRVARAKPQAQSAEPPPHPAHVAIHVALACSRRPTQQQRYNCTFRGGRRPRPQVHERLRLRGDVCEAAPASRADHAAFTVGESGSVLEATTTRRRATSSTSPGPARSTREQDGEESRAVARSPVICLIYFDICFRAECPGIWRLVNAWSRPARDALTVMIIGRGRDAPLADAMRVRVLQAHRARRLTTKRRGTRCPAGRAFRTCGIRTGLPRGGLARRFSACSRQAPRRQSHPVRRRPGVDLVAFRG